MQINGLRDDGVSSADRLSIFVEYAAIISAYIIAVVYKRAAAKRRCLAGIGLGFGGGIDGVDELPIAARIGALPYLFPLLACRNRLLSLPRIGASSA